jgi:hypothetical protein
MGLIIGLGIMAALIGLTIYSLYQCFLVWKSDLATPSKVLWSLALIFLCPLGLVLWLVLGKKR